MVAFLLVCCWFPLKTNQQGGSKDFHFVKTPGKNTYISSRDTFPLKPTGENTNILKQMEEEKKHAQLKATLLEAPCPLLLHTPAVCKPCRNILMLHLDMAMNLEVDDLDDVH